MGKRSIKTTVGGVASILASAVALLQAFANTPGDGIDWAAMAPVIASTIGGISAGIALIFARDNDVSSQDVGIRPAPNPAAEAAAAEAFRR